MAFTSSSVAAARAWTVGNFCIRPLRLVGTSHFSLADQHAQHPWRVMVTKRNESCCARSCGRHLHPPPEVLRCSRDLRLLAHDLADPHEVDELLLRQAQRRRVALCAIGGALAAGIAAPGARCGG